MRRRVPPLPLCNARREPRQPFAVSLPAEAVSPADAEDVALEGAVLGFAAHAAASTGHASIAALDNAEDAPDKAVTVFGAVSLNSVPCGVRAQARPGQSHDAQGLEVPGELGVQPWIVACEGRHSEPRSSREGSARTKRPGLAGGSCDRPDDLRSRSLAPKSGRFLSRHRKAQIGRHLYVAVLQREFQRQVDRLLAVRRTAHETGVLMDHPVAVAPNGVDGPEGLERQRS